MQNHLSGFLYDLRYVYQGKRDVELVDNRLEEYIKDFNGIKKKDVTDKYAYYSFNYFVPDLILNML